MIQTEDNVEKVRIALSISKVSFEDITFGDKYRSRIPVIYGIHNEKGSVSDEDSSLLFQSPELVVHEDIVRTDHPDFYQFETLFEGPRKNSPKRNQKRIDAWRRFLEQLEMHFKKFIMKKGTLWFPKSKCEFRNLIKDSKKGINLEHLKWTVDVENCEIVNEQGEEVDIRAIKKGVVVKMVIEILGGWINESTSECGYATFLKKIRVENNTELPPKIKTVSKYDFGESDDEESEIEDERESEMINILSAATEQRPRKKHTSKAPASTFEINFDKSIKTDSVVPTPPGMVTSFRSEAKANNINDFPTLDLKMAETDESDTESGAVIDDMEDLNFNESFTETKNAKNAKSAKNTKSKIISDQPPIPLGPAKSSQKPVAKPASRVTVEAHRFKAAPVVSRKEKSSKKSSNNVSDFLGNLEFDDLSE